MSDAPSEPTTTVTHTVFVIYDYKMCGYVHRNVWPAREGSATFAVHSGAGAHHCRAQFHTRDQAKEAMRHMRVQFGFKELVLRKVKVTCRRVRKTDLVPQA